MCGLRTRPRTDLDQSRVELPSAGSYRLAAPGAIICCGFGTANPRPCIEQVEIGQEGTTCYPMLEAETQIDPEY